MTQKKKKSNQRQQASGQVNKKKNKKAQKQLAFGQADKKRNKKKKNPHCQACGLVRIRKRKTKNKWS